jgi:hypothetical protein
MLVEVVVLITKTKIEVGQVEELMVGVMEVLQ